MWGVLFGFDVYYLHLEVVQHAYFLSALYGGLTLLAGYMIVSKVRELWVSDQ